MQTPLIAAPQSKCYPSIDVVVSQNGPVVEKTIPLTSSNGAIRVSSLHHEKSKRTGGPGDPTCVPYFTRVMELELEVQSLKEENEKLRAVEDQFWALLKENEELKSIVQRNTDPIAASPINTRELACATRQGIIGEEGENMCCSKYSSALRQCMDLLLERELGGATGCDSNGAWRRQLEQRDSVATYVLWLRSKQHAMANRDMPLHTWNSCCGETMHNVTTVQQSLKDTDVMFMQCQLENVECELKDTREVLKLVDASRSAALEDCERMSKQINMLTEHLKIMIKDHEAIREVRVENEALCALLERQTREIKARDQLLADMRAMVQKMQNVKCSESSLAGENERIWREFLERQGVAISLPVME